MQCGHRCPSVCGDPCPDPSIACRVCATENAKNHVVDLIVFATLAEYNVEESGPLIALPCGHVYSMESLDGHVQLGEHYHRDSSGRWGTAQEQGLELKRMISCPDCRGPITGVLRYGRVVNASVLDNMACKFHIDSQATLGKVRERLQEVSQKKQCQQI